MTKSIHIIGCGLAGLSAAAHLRQKGYDCHLYDAAPKAGGRIRAIDGPVPYDNGTHLIIKGYKDSLDYLELIGARQTIRTLTPAAYTFVEPKKGKRWSLAGHKLIRSIIQGRIPAVNILTFWHSVAYRRLWDPLALAIFNTNTAEVDRPLIRQTFKELLKQGSDSAIPYAVDKTLYDSFVAPILQDLSPKFGQRLVAVDDTQLTFRNHQVDLPPDARVILALPPQAYKSLSTPFDMPAVPCNPITNVHFWLEQPIADQFIGLIGTLSQWVMVKGNHICVTISNHQSESKTLALQVWDEIAPPLGLQNKTFQNYRVICEKYATPRQDSAFCAKRPKVITQNNKIFLAGDWIDTGLPATIESAIRSGKQAAQAVQASYD